MDSSISIDLAKRSEAEELMRFVREQWSADHVLGSSRELLDWQHAADDGYNFVVGRSRSQGVVGVLGFIPLSRYDAELHGARDTVWLALWKVRDGVSSGLGLRLLLHVQSMFPHACVGTIGLNPATRGIYEALGYRTGTLTRFALVRTDVRAPMLAKFPVGWTPPSASPGDAVASELHRTDFLERTAGLGLDDGGLEPVKSRAYVQRRYFEHPFYTYRVWLLSDGRHHGVLVTRMSRYQYASAVRIVDFIGDPAVLAGAGRVFEGLLQSSGAEYLDFFSTGLSAELQAAGLFDAAQVPGLVLPGHFEPFDRKNVELAFSLRGSGERVVLCKGDADQDRPNRLPVTS